MQPSTHERLAEIRRDNLLRVLNGVLSLAGQVGVDEVSTISGLSVATVRQGLQQIAEAGVVEATMTRSASGIGRPAMRFAPADELPTVLVMRVGMARAQIVAVTLAGEQLHEASHPLGGDESCLAEDLVDHLRAFLEACPISPACFVLTVTGIVNEGRVIKSVRHPAMEDNETLEAIRRAAIGDSDAEFLLVNDSKVAASWTFEQADAADVSQQAVVCHVDDSISCGLVVDGKVLQGAHGAAGEVDNTGQGPWSRADQRLGDATFRKGVSGAEFFSSAQHEEPAALAATESILTNIAEAIAPLTLAFDPGLLLISGEILRVQELAEAALRDRVLAKTPLPPELRFVHMDGSAVMEGSIALAVRTARDCLVRSIVAGSA